MADAITNQTTLAEAMRTGIVERAVYYYDAYSLFPKLTADWRKLVPQGEKATVYRQLDILTITTHTEGTATDSEEFDYVGRTLTPAVFQCNVLIGVESIGSADANIEDDIGQAAAAAMTRYIDGATTYGFAADYAEAPTSNPDHAIGTASTALTASLARQAFSLLANAGAKQPYHWVIAPLQVEELWRDPEARDLLKKTGGEGVIAQLGVDANRWLGTLYGFNVWQADAMISSSGLHSMAFGQGAMGMAYKVFPNAYTGNGDQEFLVDVTKQTSGQIGNRIQFASWFDIDGIAWTPTTNKFIVDIIS